MFEFLKSRHGHWLAHAALFLAAPLTFAQLGSPTAETAQLNGAARLDGPVALESLTPAAVELSADRTSYVPGEVAQLRATLPAVPPPGSSVHLFVLRELDVGEAETVWEFDEPFTGLDIAFLAFLEQARTHVAGVVVTGPDGTAIQAGAIDLFVNAQIAGLPAELTTYEAISLDVAALRDAALAAVESSDVLDLQLGTRSYALILEDNSEVIEGVDTTPFGSVALYRGSVVGVPGSTVALTFVNDTFHALIDPLPPSAQSDAMLLVEPTALHDPSRPAREHIAYLARDVLVPPHDLHDPAPLVDPGTQRPPQSDGTAGAQEDTEFSDAPESPEVVRWNWRLGIFMFSDTGFTTPTWRIFQHINAADAVFRSRQGTRVFGLIMYLINTNAYPDVANGFYDQFRSDHAAFGLNAFIDVLFTNNPANIAYGNVLGQGWWSRAQFAGDANAYAWVRNAGSDYVCLLTTLHEVSHVLGASDSASGHSSEVLRSRCTRRIFGICVRRHYIYSVMRATLDPQWVAPEWRSTDSRALQRVIRNTPGHFK